MLFRVFERPDGSVALWRPGEAQKRAGEDDAAFFEREGWRAEKDPSLAGLDYVDIDRDELPPDRADRDAWRLEGGKVVVGKGRTDG
jgi:hypothetical protein